MATDDLLMRLKQLEDSYYGDKEAARQQSFMDTYGARFSNNRGLGLAILNELDAQGIDTSAADEAVTAILDQLRTECNEILESIKEQQQSAIDTARKVETIQNVVSEKLSTNPEASIDGGTPPTDGAAVPPDDMLNAMDPNNMPTDDLPPDFVPPDEGAGGGMPPPPDEGAGGDMPPPPDEDAGGDMPPPPDEGGQLPPNEVESDRRVKRIKQLKSGLSAHRASRCWKPSAGIISAALGGM